MTQVANKFEQVMRKCWVSVALGKQCHFIASKQEGKLNTANIVKHKLSTSNIP